ncbi:glycosyl hydrolase family 18 protein [Enterobacter bugandensis]|uniref:glycosyl hydrolase family 18 protein n=1 Tax=Enterobacter bugandensis TaxID=881260 RepID=UPI00048065E6|nr:glycosyl hydrolase family 18 protein [Enterobacter bugandensis]MCK6730095.1 glycosyl hydrolase family 18 protein [Enterobacter bugandensis]MCK6810864.1 glycosyl hydrolase family 18 protein [Enterobacter bugandensis]MCK7197737.1 glycosyl hydrolase family 18 protein [Enterobacter bugandensis]MCK7206520.1 glycosyl hydrolase family 18 protein [Enterobacter bugandensis]MDK7610401.1 glycosyl hydrolase family 18 protein [Enterobacter bugandensis]
MKKLTLSLLIGSALMAQSAFAAQAPRAVTYLTSWGVPVESAEDMKEVKADTFLLSFGGWDASGKLSSSDNIVAVPQYDPWYINAPAYVVWSQLKLAHPEKKMMLALGGETYSAMWSYLNNAQTRETLAQNLVNLLNTNFPVYKKNLKPEEMVGECLSADWQGKCNMANYQKAGTVQLDGIDFDFEKPDRVTPEENANLLDLAERVRSKLNASGSKKLLSLTTYHVGADPENCTNSAVTENCSFVEAARSSHHGEVLPLLTQGKNVFDFFNVMAYDAGPRFKYDVAMANYARAVGDKSKIVLGQTINSQWGPEGRFVENRQNNVNRAGWQAENGYGGFFIWTLGSNDQQLSIPQQVDYFNEMKERADLMSPERPQDTVAPTAPAGLKVLNNGLTITLAWQPSTDDRGVVGYDIYRNDIKVGSSTDTQWTDNAVETGGVVYHYSVKARDAANNISESSNVVKVETVQVEEGRPDAPGGLALVSSTENSLTVKWNAVDNAVKYHVLRDGAELLTVSGTQIFDSGLRAGTTYSYQVIAENAKGHQSLASTPLKATTKEGSVTPEPEGEWKVGTRYKTGEIVTYHGTQYRCVQGHTSQSDWAPTAAATLWQPVP